MDKIRIKKYKSAVYTSLVFASVVLAFLGNYIFTQETLKAIVINLASELLAVGILFFIVDLIFSIGEDENSVFDEIATIKEEIVTQQGLTIKAQSERLDRAFDLVIKEIEKIKGSSEEYAKILKAIRDVSKYSDEIKERIEINAERERLESERDSLKEQLKESQTALREKTREANRKGEELAQRRQEVIVHGVGVSVGSKDGTGSPWRAARHASTK
ncbi:hypothetical protein IQ268_30995 [Oculatella sp. LEGE 06141]|uniref:hypothetical protein n=1 Tax=Oculatella sp. LEGE 06141 TaxID=1828648 RepID=UPI00187FD742|nr:hypothetical protein [Oculatella sp. LEGE 06141]MBE9182966.1 hypothetical protein [Oculatella sp. LEGE 06141]